MGNVIKRKLCQGCRHKSGTERCGVVRCELTGQEVVSEPAGDNVHWRNCAWRKWHLLLQAREARAIHHNQPEPALVHAAA